MQEATIAEEFPEYPIEFQKCGHAHIVLWVASEDKLLTPTHIDEVICAELRDKVADPVGYKAIFQFMMHGPCGATNPKCPCMYKGRCTKHFPKAFRDDTTMDDDGYALYRRRYTKTIVECNNILLGSRGPETATFVLERADQRSAVVNQPSISVQRADSDEINYLSCRYVSATEASWRIFEFTIHHREPFVQRLYFHLENEKEVGFILRLGLP